jgi:Rieske Fe-S protein
VVEKTVQQPAAQPPGQSTSDPGAPQSSGSTPPAANAAAQPLAKVDEVPVGGGVVLKDQKLVLTRDAEGNAHAFSAVCTHQGCLVSSVAEGTINCKCHNSKFDVTSGEPVGGPAKKPLPSVGIEERDGAIFQA